MKMKNFVINVLNYQRESCTHGLRDSETVCEKCKQIVYDQMYGDEYEITWWETRTYKCSVVIKAGSQDRAEKIAMHPFLDESREWTEAEEKTYSEDLKETTAAEIIEAKRKDSND